MTKNEFYYSLIKDKLYKVLNYYTNIMLECNDFSEAYLKISWYLVESSEIVCKSDLDRDSKKHLLKFITSEIVVLFQYYKSLQE